MKKDSVEKENDRGETGRRMVALYESERLTRQSRPYTVALVRGPVKAHTVGKKRKKKKGKEKGKGGCDVRG